MTSSVTAGLLLPALAAMLMPWTLRAGPIEDCIDPSGPGPVFRTLRYEESFCDRVATASDPWWFGLKNLSVGPATVSVGGEARARFEQVSPVRLGLRDGTDDHYVTARGLVHVDARLGDHWRLFGQLGYWDGYGRSGGPAVTDIDRGDLQQGFVEWHDDAAFVRLGRQEAVYGNGRLISLRQAPNIRQAFDGARVGFPLATGTMEVLYLRPVVVDPGAWNNQSNSGERVAGFYFTHGPRAGHLGFDAYALRFNRKFQRYQNAMGDEERTVVGGRLFGQLGRMTLTSEFALQSGHVGNESVRAWAFQNDAAWKASASSAWTVGVKANAASGDSDPDDGTLETYQPMYAAAPYLMQSSLLAMANLRNVQPYVEWEPLARLTLTGELQANWRMETSDGFYQPPLVVNALDNRGHFVGSQAGLSARWAARKDLLIEAWTSRFLAAGPLVRAGAHDTTFFAMQATYSF